MTRGELKKLLPTCKQPARNRLAAAKAFQEKQQAIQTRISEGQPADERQSSSADCGRGQLASQRRRRSPRNARCIVASRPDVLPASCTGNALLGAFGQMFSAGHTDRLAARRNKPQSGPDMAGVFVGAGSWRLDFIDGGVLVNCSFLSPNRRTTQLNFSGRHASLTINTRPKPLVLTLHADGTTLPAGTSDHRRSGCQGDRGRRIDAGSHRNRRRPRRRNESMRTRQARTPATSLRTPGGGTYDATHHDDHEHVRSWHIHSGLYHVSRRGGRPAPRSTYRLRAQA